MALKPASLDRIISQSTDHDEQFQSSPKETDQLEEEDNVDNDPIIDVDPTMIQSAFSDQSNELNDADINLATSMMKNKPTEGKWKRFHMVLISSCIIAPTLLILTFIIATYINGRNLIHYSISAGIQFNPLHPSVYTLTVINTMISAILSFFVSICRQIEISSQLTDYAETFPDQRKKLTHFWRANNVAVFFNITNYLGLVLLVIFDSSRYSAHVYLSTYAFWASGCFLFITCVVSTEERYMEYRMNLIQYEESKPEAFRRTFIADVVLLWIAFLIGAICMWIYLGEFMKLDGTTANVSTTKQQVSVGGNIAEWLSFGGLTSAICILALSFDHDSVDDELIKFWKGVLRWITKQFSNS